MGFLMSYTNKKIQCFKALYVWETKERTTKHRKLIKEGKQKELLTE